MRFLTATSLWSGIAVLFVASSVRADTPLPPQSSASEATAGTVSVHLSQSETPSGPAWARFASGKGMGLFVASGVLFPLTEGHGGDQRALRAADSLLTSTLVTEALKRVIHEERPDGTDYKSFPSGHATAAFAIASMQAHFHPDQAIFWYLGATAIAASRVKLRRHHVRDVLAGAAVGIATTQIEIHQRHGLLLFPFIHGTNSSQQRVAGLSFGGSF